MGLIRIEKSHLKIWSQNVTLFFLLLIPATLLGPKYSFNSLMIIIASCLTVVNFFFVGRPKASFKIDSYFFIILIYFAFLLLFVLKADNYNDGFRVIQKKIPLLILPFLVFYNKDLINKYLKLFYLIFIIAVIGASIYCSIKIIGDWRMSGKNISELITYYKFTSSYFSEKLDIHPSYFSNFILLAILFINQLFKPINRLTYKLGLIIIWIFLSIILIQLGSRLHILNYGFLIIYFVYSEFNKESGLRNYSFYFKIVLGLATMIFLLKSNFIKNRFEQGYDMYFNQGKNYPEYYEGNRMNIWKHVPGLVKNAPILGVGTGNENNRLHQKFIDDSYQLGIDNHLNFHNQYFQELVRSGIIGFVIFATMCYFMFAKAVKKKMFMYIAFLLFNLSFFLVESVLERHRGIVFFFFFTTFFYYCYGDKKHLFEISKKINTN